jgi:hypothetical protein
MLIEPYVNGKIHGTAKQYGRDGSVIGTYTLRHGTGYDIWRVENEDGATNETSSNMFLDPDESLIVVCCAREAADHV